jgi:hypothetical protein
MEFWNAAAKKAVHPTKALPDIVLRRRIALTDTPYMAVLESFCLTTLPDPCITLLVKPTPRLKEPVADPRWPDKNAVKKCSISGKPFGMFEWKKRCKVSGNIHCDAVCDYE